MYTMFIWACLYGACSGLPQSVFIDISVNFIFDTPPHTTDNAVLVLTYFIVTIVTIVLIMSYRMEV